MIAAAAVAVVCTTSTQFDQHDNTADAESQMTAPTRVLDTRSGIGARWGRLQPGEVLPLEIGGINANDNTAVFMNLTAVDPDQPGFVTAWPCAQAKPATSLVNFEPGRAVPNMAVLAYPAGGLCFSASSPVHLIADVTAVTTAGEVTGIAPQRLYDSRAHTRLQAGVELPISIAQQPGIPADASSAALNVTVVGPSQHGYATVKPCGSGTDASTINFMAGEIVAHFTFGALTNGTLCIVSSTSTDVIIDAFGWVGAASPIKTMAPKRVLDTRASGDPTSDLMSGETVEIALGDAGIPANAGGAIVNVVAADGSEPGFVTVWPCGQEPPVASTLNLWPFAVPSNQAMIKLSDTDKLCLRPFIAGGSQVHLVVDLVGYALGTTNLVLPPPPVFDPPTPVPGSGPVATPTTRAASRSGTIVGSQSYPVPDGAIVVSPAGNDNWPGTNSQPVRSVSRALAIAKNGSTIVMRGGIYHEAINVNKQVTLQAWPGEEVWFDGAVPVTGWVGDGGDWRLDGWNVDFDTSPTYTRGAADGADGWGFVDPAYPMANHPDQVWVDATPMRQVGSRAEVVPGTFYHDRGGNRIYLGTNPAGHTVAAVDIVKAIRVTADGAVLRGFGVRRYAPSVPDLAAVVVERSAVLEHIAVTDSSTGGISVANGKNVTLRNVYVGRAGMVGIHGNYADNLTLERVFVDSNNFEHFNPSPSAGGAKITRSRVVTVRDSIFSNNAATGLWFDQSVYDMRITGSDFRNNTRGAFVEISSTLVFADNVVEGNEGDGLLINNTSNASVWNNTFVGNTRNLVLAQDNRRPYNTSYGQDPRYPNDASMTWLVGPVRSFNNVMALPRTASAPCLFCATGYAAANAMGITSNGNVFNRANSSSPSVLVLWTNGNNSDNRYRDLAQHQNATGQDGNSVLVQGNAAVTAIGTPTAAMPSSNIAVPLDGYVASLTGRTAGSKQLGAWGA